MPTPEGDARKWFLPLPTGGLVRGKGADLVRFVRFVRTFPDAERSEHTVPPATAYALPSPVNYFLKPAWNGERIAACRIRVDTTAEKSVEDPVLEPTPRSS